MKKALLFAGLAAAALSFVGCNKEADLAPQSKSVEIVLTDAQTRTVNDGMSTIWKQGDELTVFYAPASTTDWSANTKFTVQDVSSNRATGEVTLEEDAYDWYAFYPYTKQLPNPTTLNPEGSQYERSGYTTVGGLIQSQKEDDNTEHLAGKNVPVFGNVKSVPANEMPAIEMKNAASVLRFKVTNAKTEAIHILSVKFFAPEDIVGTYYIDFSGTTPSFVGSGDKYVSDSVTVTNSTPVDLAPDSNSEFYAVIKPFTAASGSKLKIEVEAETVDGSKRGIATKEITLTAATQFKAGYIKTLTVPFDASFESFSATTLAEAITLEDNTEVELETLTVGAVSTKGYVVTDGTNGLYVYLNSTPTVKVGDQVNVSGKLATYYNVRQLTNSSYTEVASGDGTFEATWTDITANFETYTNTTSAPVKYQATVVKNGTYTNFKVEGADTFVGTLTNAPSSMFEGINEGDKVNVFGYFSTINQGNKLVGVYAYKLEVVSSGTPILSAELVGDATVPATTTSVKVNVGGNVEWRVEAEDGSEALSFNPASGTGSAQVTVSFPANTSTTDKVYTFFVRTSDPTLVDAGDDEIMISFTQSGATSAFDATISWDSYADWGLELNSSGNVIAQNPISLTCGDYLVTIDKKNGSSNPFVHGTANDARAYAKATVTVKNTKAINMTELVFNLSAQGLVRLAPITADNGTVATQQLGDNTVTWTGEATEVTFTVGDKAVYGTDGDSKSGQLCFLSIDVNEGGQGVVKALVSIAVTGQKTEFAVGDAFTHDTAVVTATYSDNTTKDVTASATFSSPDMTTAGTKTVTVSYTEGGVPKSTTYDIVVSAPSTITVSQACALADDASASVSDAIVAALCTRGFIATDGTKNIYVFENKQPTVVLGDKVSFSAVKTTYFGLPELKTITNLTVTSSNNEIPRTAVVDITSTLDTYSSSDTDYLTVTGTLEKSGSYYNVRVAGATRYATPMYLYGIDPSALVGQSVVMTGYFNTINSGKGAVQFIATEIKLADSNTKYCTVSPEELNVAATDQSATFTIQANAAWTVTSDNSAFTVSPASGNADATVTVSFSANGTTAARVANLTVSCPDASVSKTVVLTQAAPASQEESYTIVFGNKANSPTGISATTKAGTVISSGTDYVTNQPFTVDSGNVYYGDTQDCIRLGKTGTASQLTIALSDAGKISASSIVVKCMKMQGSKNTNAQLTVNGVGPKSPATNGDPASDLSFSLSSTGNLESIVLEGTAGIFIYSITVNK